MKKSQRELQKRTGNIYQLAGTCKMSCDEGKGKGTSIIRVRNGNGLDFCLLPDRGLDFFESYYNGVPLAWISKTGLVGNQFMDDKDYGWFKSFTGGMITTCGLRNTGPACDVEGEHFGLHGRYNFMPADNINIREYWENDVFHSVISGEIREANTFGENLLVKRTVSVNSRDNTIFLSDHILNEGFKPEPIMLLYHMNWGYPFFNENSNLILNSDRSYVRETPDKEATTWNDFSKPVHDFNEIVYFHDLNEEANGKIKYTLQNKELGFEVTTIWDKKELPWLSQWKMTGEGEYVLGLEPCNCLPLGRDVVLDDNTIEVLEPGQEKQIKMEININKL